MDSVRVVWPGNKAELIRKASVNQTILVDRRNASEGFKVKDESSKTLLRENHVKYDILFRHTEDDFVDYKQGQSLLLHKHSQAGPGLAVGDIDGDGLEDFIVGGPANRTTEAFLQQRTGKFTRRSLFSKKEEDMGILLFDADNDNDLDLYCVSGSSEYGLNTKYYQHRF